MLWEAVIGSMGWPWVPGVKFAGLAAFQGLLAPVFVAALRLRMGYSGGIYLCLRVSSVKSLGADA
jgi:hypothetical protein